jgi:hypothetical protein
MSQWLRMAVIQPASHIDHVQQIAREAVDGYCNDESPISLGCLLLHLVNRDSMDRCNVTFERVHAP